MDFSLYTDTNLLWWWRHFQNRCWNGDMNAYPLLCQVNEELSIRRISFSGQRY